MGGVKVTSKLLPSNDRVTDGNVEDDLADVFGRILTYRNVSQRKSTTQHPSVLLRIVTTNLVVTWSLLDRWDTLLGR